MARVVHLGNIRQREHPLTALLGGITKGAEMGMKYATAKRELAAKESVAEQKVKTLNQQLKESEQKTKETKQQMEIKGREHTMEVLHAESISAAIDGTSDADFYARQQTEGGKSFNKNFVSKYAKEHMNADGTHKRLNSVESWEAGLKRKDAMLGQKLIDGTITKNELLYLRQRQKGGPLKDIAQYLDKASKILGKDATPEETFALGRKMYEDFTGGISTVYKDHFSRREPLDKTQVDPLTEGLARRP